MEKKAFKFSEHLQLTDCIATVLTTFKVYLNFSLLAIQVSNCNINLLKLSENGIIYKSLLCQYLNSSPLDEAIRNLLAYRNAMIR